MPKLCPCLDYSYKLFVSGVPNRGLLGSLHPLTPNVAEDSPDTQGAENLVIQGALHSGKLNPIGSIKTMILVHS
jgi:hypothetical protein